METKSKCPFCGSDMEKCSETDVSCYKRTNKKCGYSFVRGSKMKSKEEILEEIESLKRSRETFVTQTVEWRMFNYAIIKLEWVLDE